ncbi:sensor histidine kinase [Clostridium pasteurianum]|uniref:Putative regulator of cell autolysis n=1 Tax=Clostridium pasteurianum BC1 TaxID=86416 RepID=R4K0Y5_CLOPA|nr:sensor histidine kinase [Clostridium pasteurianum]AGK96752.1 putative regulator of cell autolysis [Clostridium pasteurianum BC1]
MLLYIFNMLTMLMERAMWLLLILFIVTRIKSFRKIFQKDNYEKKDIAIICAIFSAFAILETYSGIRVDGSLVNIRIITIVSAGILFGPEVGIITGLVAGTHRFLIDIHGVTSIPCLITSIVAGISSGYVNKRVERKYLYIAGILLGMICEILTMVFILIMTKPYELGLNIVSKISIPMILGEISVGFIILLMQFVEDEKEMIAGQQSKLALDIANETLPYFRNINNESLRKICIIIKEHMHADAVSITDKTTVLAYVGVDEEIYNVENKVVNETTKTAILKNEILINNDSLKNGHSNLKSAIIIPFEDKNGVNGTLKIYYKDSNKITYSIKALTIGLSQIISTLMEVSKVEQIKETANKAEIRALQRQINPHFLFNALNAITSFIRINPDKARELIINLSSYLRYNLEINDELIDIKKELKQVKDFVEIEKARFGDKLNLIYDIDDVNIKVPSLIIQPLVENAIIHGILPKKGKGTIKLSVKNCEDESVKITVEDSGVGISEDIIKNVYSGNVPENKIGLYNVYLRLKLIYGEGIKIKRLEKGTRMEFLIRR